MTARYPSLTQNRIFVGLLVLSLLLLVLILVLILPHGTTTPTDEDSFDQLSADYWAELSATFPVTATAVGETGAVNGRLTNLSWSAILAGRDRRAALYQRGLELQGDLATITDATERLNAQLLLQLLDYEHRRDAYLELDWLMPISTETGPQLDLPGMVDITEFATREDYVYYLSRLAGVATYIDQTIALMDQGIAAGITQACDFIQAIPDQIAVQIVDDPADSDFYRPFIESNSNSNNNGQVTQEMRSQARQLIAEQIVPAYQRLASYFTGTYLQRCHTAAAGSTVGLGALPGGAGYYAALVVEYTTDAQQTPEGVQALGVQQVQLVRGQMDAALARSGYNGTMQAYLDHLRAAPEYQLPPAQLMAYARSFAKTVDALLPEYFALLPRCPYAIRQVPEGVDESSPAGYYNEPDPECTRPGYFYLNTYPGKVATYLLPSLFLHEAVPGHHLQLALETEMPALPKFRLAADFTAFVEGWAHFAEYFGEDMGFYDDPATDIGRLSDAMLRACRLVIDSGLHAGNLTRAQAIDLLVTNSALALADIHAEVDRYGSWPGQATAYRTGALKFFALRNQAMTQLGDAFDLRHFYSAVLANGAVPMSVLQTIVDDYIDAQKSS